MHAFSQDWIVEQSLNPHDRTLEVARNMVAGYYKTEQVRLTSREGGF